jgi:hypothetical protein
MKILAIEHETTGAAAEDFAPLLEDEARQVWNLYQAGVIREIYFQQERNDAVLVLEYANLAEAEETLSGLPLVAAGLIWFELIGLRAYPGFERLFRREERMNHS